MHHDDAVGPTPIGICSRTGTQDVGKMGRRWQTILLG